MRCRKATLAELDRIGVKWEWTQGYRDAGRELTLEEWRREPAKATFLDGLMRLTSALS